MTEKIYCSQCHNSAFTHAKKRNREVRSRELCLYCFKRKIFMHKNHLIGDCRKFTPESREKYFSGKWKANVGSVYEY